MNRTETNIITLEMGWAVLDQMMKILEEDLLRAETVEEIEHVKKEFVSMHYMNLYSLVYEMSTQRTPFNWSSDLYKRHCTRIKQVADALINNNDTLMNLDHKIKMEEEGSGKLHEVLIIWTRYETFRAITCDKMFRYLRFHVKRHSLESLSTVGVNAVKDYAERLKSKIEIHLQRRPKEMYVVMILSGERSIQDVAKEAKMYSYVTKYINTECENDKPKSKYFDFLDIDRRGHVKFSENLNLECTRFAQYLAESSLGTLP